MSALRHARPTPSRPFATPDAAHPHPATGEGWAATLELAFERRAHASVLAHVRHRGPLTVQRPLYPEGPETCHAIVVHPPGGVAGGDTLDLDIELREHAHAVLTMPGAAKFYPAHGRRARQHVALRVHDGAIVEWLPPETIVFDGADARTSLEIELGEGASVLGWDIVALGRRARGEAFGRGRWRQRLAIRRAGRLIVDDTLDLAGGDPWLGSGLGLAGASVCGTLFAAGLGLDAVVVTACRDAVASEAARIGVTMPLPGLLMARCLADEAEAVRHAFIALWTRLRPALTGREARPLRLWAT